MEWVLRLVGTGVDGQSRSFNVMEISRPDGVGDIANLGLTLAEGKLLLARVQQGVVAAQAEVGAGGRAAAELPVAVPELVGKRRVGVRDGSESERRGSRRALEAIRGRKCSVALRPGLRPGGGDRRPH